MPTNAKRIVLPNAVTGDPVERFDQVGDPDLGLPHVLRDLWDANEERIRKYTAADQDTTMWRGYRFALADIWRCFKHLYEE
jgi:hypothetical protein